MLRLKITHTHQQTKVQARTNNFTVVTAWGKHSVPTFTHKTLSHRVLQMCVVIHIYACNCIPQSWHCTIAALLNLHFNAKVQCRPRAPRYVVHSFVNAQNYVEIPCAEDAESTAAAQTHNVRAHPACAGFSEHTPQRVHINGIVLAYYFRAYSAAFRRYRV